MVSLTFNIGRKAMIFFGVVILVFVVAGLVIGYGGTDPTIHGHSAGEIEGCGGGATYDSGWFAVETAKDYILDHDLGTSSLIVQIYFSSDGTEERVMRVFEGFHTAHYTYSGGAVVDYVTDTQLMIKTGLQDVTGTCAYPNDDVGAWGESGRMFSSRQTSGYYKVIATTSAGSGDSEGFIPSNYVGQESVTLPNGLIMKTGQYVTTLNYEEVTMTFDNSFTTKPTVIVTQEIPSTSSWSTPYDVGTKEVSVDGFIVKSRQFSGSTIHWMAIGY